VKVGDLVTVTPACLNVYVIVERLSHDGDRLSLWSLHDGKGAHPMTQRFMKIISSAPDLEKS